MHIFKIMFFSAHTLFRNYDDLLRLAEVLTGFYLTSRMLKVFKEHVDKKKVIQTGVEELESYKFDK